MSHYEERMKQLGGKPKRKRPKKGQLTREGEQIAKSADKRLVTDSEVARSFDVPDAVITRLWRTNAPQD